MLKRLLMLLTALALCAGLFGCKKDPEEPDDPPPTGNFGEEWDPTLAASGTFEGSSVSWRVQTDGTLYIEGTGAMPEFSSAITDRDTPQPWAKYRSGSEAVISRVVVKNGVTALAAWAFAYCPYIESVSLPPSLTALPESCFAFCSSLTSVRGGTGLVTIADSAFSECRKLAELELSPALETVEFGAFANAALGEDGLTVLFEGGNTAWEAEKPTLTVAGKQGANKVFYDAIAKDPSEE